MNTEMINDKTAVLEHVFPEAVHFQKTFSQIRITRGAGWSVHMAMHNKLTKANIVHFALIIHCSCLINVICS